jgi:predicted  nucleic acid-binding Zn-ribbon protein
LKQRCDGLTAQRDELATRYPILEHERDEARSKCTALEQELESLKQRCDGLVEEAAVLERERDEARSTCTALEQERMELVAVLEATRTENAALGQDRDDLRILVDSAQRFLTATKQARATAEDERDDALTRVTKLKERDKQLRALVVSKNDIVTQQAAELEDLKGTLEQLRAEIDHLREPPSPPPSPPPPPDILLPLPPPPPPTLEEVDYAAFDAPAGMEEDEEVEPEPEPGARRLGRRHEDEEEVVEEAAAAHDCYWWHEHGGKNRAKPCAGPIVQQVRRDFSTIWLCAAHTCTEKKTGCRIMTRAPQGCKCTACMRTKAGKKKVRERDRRRKRPREDSAEEEGEEMGV